MMKALRAVFAATTALCAATAANATDLEVTHWWTSGGEAAAVAEFAKAFDATGNKWVDGAIAGSGGTARPIMISRITGGDPMGATQFNHGRQAEELVEAGLMRDLTDIAEEGNWKEVIHPSSLLDSCTLDGRIYCVPVNIHSQQWLWLNNKVFEDNGLAVPTNWDEYAAAAPKLQEAGIVPLAMGQQPWQTTLAFQVLLTALAGPEAYTKIFGEKDAELAGSEEMAKVFQAAATARDMSKDSNVQGWNDATTMVITGKAAGQIMGDWAQGEFQVANQVAGEDYTCLPGLGVNEVIMTGGDAFYFPKVDDPAITEAQGELAKVMLSPEAQVAFNLKKGSLPVRGDVDLAAANDCMKKGLDILAKGNVIQSPDQLMSADSLTQVNDLFVEFFNNPSMTAEDAQSMFASIVGNAD
ncbi:MULTISPECIES: ABC transporter substrate-binding protein [Stappiaceae]|jgi:glucose/mannose transport system substrate-binding protein|nr:MULTISPECIES: ABC transporter substrate-binding protein [Stappiaceae]MEC9421983.1 ABC transporter substrate-binding protein [Pseudomonadota bacterium]AMN55435.1 ABC transporter substrate-binding protein [Labrenzia sp. CP4]AQQ04065.1 ABC transporter substrate-binding protein [Roseibium aggregatum]ERP97476.1 ABC transporter substrate-binding protein [Labrenzia sp. C1B10]ERS08843.1 ABC transporter substrate-binding protein [Labrenzia sp. C1B70]